MMHSRENPLSITILSAKNLNSSHKELAMQIFYVLFLVRQWTITAVQSVLITRDGHSK